MKKTKLYQIDPINLILKDEKLLTQIWNDQYPDCISLEEMLRRFLLQKVKKEVRLRAAFNIYKKMRKNSNIEEIFARLNEKKLLDEAVKSQLAKYKAEKEAKQNENASDEN